jgi:hypothetical protein
MLMVSHLVMAAAMVVTTAAYAADTSSTIARPKGTPWQQLARIEPPVMHAPAISLDAAAIETCTSLQGCIIPERLSAPVAAVAVAVPTLEATAFQAPSKTELLTKAINVQSGAK